MRWLLLSLWLGVAISQAADIVVDANESAPYWCRFSLEGGMGSELLQAMSTAAGLTTQIRFVPLSRMIEDRSNNDSGNPEFFMWQQEFAAIIPIAISEMSIFYYRPRHQKPLEVNDFKDLEPYKIGVLKGILIDRKALEQMGLTFESSYTHASLFKKLKVGRIDLVIEIDLVGRQMINQLYPDLADDFVRIPLSNTVSPIAIMIDANYPNADSIAERYREGLASIIANGEYQRIVERYYPDGKLPNGWLDNLSRFQQMYAY
ncbi:transporter substrate-binding domain-containing protein [Methylotuvimicrobium sp. KM2]|uniref:substrate-binding periplasmic protein n=1 Tax=Methylotuvimicrobium sp. KM2 TaxID=3133976 RepID=UPI003100C771